MWSAELTLTNTSSSKRLLTPIKICFPLGAFVCNKQQLSFDENFSAFHWPGASLLVHHVTCKKSLQVTSIWHELFASLSCVSSRAGPTTGTGNEKRRTLRKSSHWQITIFCSNLLSATKSKSSHHPSKKCILFLFTETMTTSRFTYHFYSNHTSLIWLCTIELTWQKSPFKGFKRTV